MAAAFEWAAPCGAAGEVYLEGEMQFGGVHVVRGWLHDAFGKPCGAASAQQIEVVVVAIGIAVLVTARR